MQTNDLLEKEFTRFIERVNVLLSTSNKKILYLKYESPNYIEFSIWDNKTMKSENVNKFLEDGKEQHDVYTVYNAR